ncbi:MAG: cell division protein SepF [Lachnospiraceae bacterium]|jgi:cell division inhibitor SepF|nr:cell division protein SepF [Lachnospiraceae bacterium]
MAKTGMSKFMDFLKLSDPEEDYEDDGLFDEDDDDEDDFIFQKKKKSSSYDDEDDDYAPKQVRSRQPKASNPSKLVSINSRNNRRSQVFVIKPQDISQAQTVTQYLKEGSLVVINMEGIEIHTAQRIIDFIGGACDALDGSIQGISNNIFIAAPSNVAVTGDLRDEILNQSAFTPDLNRTY